MQVVKESPHRARIGIVHSLSGIDMTCYTPDSKRFPAQFKVGKELVVVVGKAALKLSKPLPSPSAEFHQENREKSLDRV